MNAKTTATTTGPTRATWKAHGNPATALYYGAADQEPTAKGVRVAIAIERGMVVLTALEGTRKGQAIDTRGVASKFWAAPVPASNGTRKATVAAAEPAKAAPVVQVQAAPGTAEGKLTAARLVPGVQVLVFKESNGNPYPAPRKTGALVATVTGTARAGRRVVVATDQGTATVAASQTFTLAAPAKAAKGAAKAAPAKAAKATKAYAKGDVHAELGTVVWATNAWTLFKKLTNDVELGKWAWTALMADGTMFAGKTSPEVAEQARAYGRETGAIAARAPKAAAPAAPAPATAPTKAPAKAAAKATTKAPAKGKATKASK